MHTNRATSERWRTSALSAFCGAVLMIKFTAASPSETSRNTDENLPDVNCDGSHGGKTTIGATPECVIAQRLRATPAKNIQGLYEFYNSEKDEIENKKIKITPEGLKWRLFVFGVFTTLQKSLIAKILTFVLTKNRNHACFPRVGCFSPDNRMGLEIGGPVAPEEVGVKFYYHTNESRTGREVNLTNWANVTEGTYDNETQVTVIIHGFKENHKTIQVMNLTDALLTHVGGNVIVVDWAKAAAFPKYGAAAANSPMVGAEVSMFLQGLYYQHSLKPENVHLIGFSLGAHAAGFCGRHFKNSTLEWLGRITGLDPAGLLFENPNVSLSYKDAAFVDIIHTNGGTIYKLQFGRLDAMGHIDFYPNGGERQPGCESGLACSHNRAWWLFIESVQNSTCPFKSIRCRYGWHGYNVCLKENNTTSANMGYYSNNYTAKGSYYLRTKSRRPYCILNDKYDPAYIQNYTTTTVAPR